MQTQAKKFPLENLFVRIYVFFLWNNKKGRALCFSTKKNAVSVVFKCKLYLKNSIELIKKTFAATRVKIFFVTRLFGNKSIFVYLFIYLFIFCLIFVFHFGWKMLRKHYPVMKSSKRKYLRMRMFHENKNSRSKDQSKTEFHFISPPMKTNLNRYFFMAKWTFISGLT